MAAVWQQPACQSFQLPPSNSDIGWGRNVGSYAGAQPTAESTLSPEESSMFLEPILCAPELAEAWSLEQTEEYLLSEQDFWTMEQELDTSPEPGSILYITYSFAVW